MSQCNVLGAFPNESRTAARTDINDADKALASMNAGSSEPVLIYPFMLWAHTSAGVLKLRNEASTAWTEIASLGPPFIWDSDTLSTGSGLIDSATLSGTQVDVTTIPAGVIAFDLTLIAVSVNAIASIALLLGSSAGMVTTGYASVAENVGVGGVLTAGGIYLSVNISSIATSTIGHFRGVMTAGNRWTVSGIASVVSPAPQNENTFATGTVVLPGAIDRARLLTTAGAFTGGIYQLRWFR